MTHPDTTRTLPSHTQSVSTRPSTNRRGRIVATLAAVVALSALLTGCHRHDDPYSLWYRQAGTLCPQISSALLAAIGKQETGFADLTSPTGAKGPMQLTAEVFARYGDDDDGNGRASAHDVGDSIMAASRLMCTDAATIDRSVTQGLVHPPTDGGVHKLYAEAYNAGVTAIVKAGGEPCGGSYDTLTRPYGTAVIGAMHDFGQRGIG